MTEWVSNINHHKVSRFNISFFKQVAVTKKKLSSENVQLGCYAISCHLTAGTPVGNSCPCSDSSLFVHTYVRGYFLPSTQLDVVAFRWAFPACATHVAPTSEMKWNKRDIRKSAAPQRLYCVRVICIFASLSFYLANHVPIYAESETCFSAHCYACRWKG